MGVIKAILLVGLGGAMGSVSRYAVSSWVQTAWGGGFPLGTFTVNVLGCFFAGVLAALLTLISDFREEVRLLFMVGVLGGFTTFSAFAWESALLFESAQTLRAIASIILNNACGILVAWAGFVGARALFF